VQLYQSNNTALAASRIAITQADGTEVNKVVWLDRERNESIDRVVEELLQKINSYHDVQLQQAIVAKLVE
jgi:hypothetical protein